MSSIRKSKQVIKSSEITPESVYLNRRSVLQTIGTLSTGLAINLFANDSISANENQLNFSPNTGYSTTEPINSYEDITTYNNFYEFGMQKSDPYNYGSQFEPKPWSVKVSGEANKTGVFDIDDLIDINALEERIYRLRCVEAWSMVIPWVGIPLASIIKKLQPKLNAKYVAFETVYRPKQMPGQRRPTLDWPYIEGLTMQEAMHPLTIIAVGLYGKELLNQNGAPMRLVVPWKYGFKSIKSINKIHFQSKKPLTSWNISAPNEYGFLANVNPEVDHPRWSQARERRIGAGFFGTKQPTLMFNGYAEDVANLYSGISLRRNF